MTGWGPAAIAQGLGISPRQAEYLYWVCEGKTTKEIAAITGRAWKTVDTSLSVLFRRLDVHTRVQAAVMAVRAVEVPHAGMEEVQ